MPREEREKRALTNQAEKDKAHNIGTQMMIGFWSLKLDSPPRQARYLDLTDSKTVVYI